MKKRFDFFNFYESRSSWNPKQERGVEIERDHAEFFCGMASVVVVVLVMVVVVVVVVVVRTCGWAEAVAVFAV